MDTQQNSVIILCMNTRSLLNITRSPIYQMLSPSLNTKFSVRQRHSSPNILSHPNDCSTITLYIDQIENVKMMRKVYTAVC